MWTGKNNKNLQTLVEIYLFGNYSSSMISSLAYAIVNNRRDVFKHANFNIYEGK